MTAICFILGDQLNETLAAIQAINPVEDLIFLCEVAEETRYVPHHPKKIAFLFSAMRHFARQLESKGYRLRYTTLDDPANRGHLVDELLRVAAEERATAIHVTEPGEWRVLQMFQDLQANQTIPLTIHPDNRFLCPIPAFKAWAQGKKQLRMEYFYRQMRQKYRLLLDEKGRPEGGEWNYDAENRKNANQLKSFPARPKTEADAFTEAVLQLVSARFSHHFGDLLPFDLAVTRAQALIEVEHFMQQGLPSFGDYQDAMRQNEPYLFHSRLSFYLNAGLLLPLELCQRAEQAYREGLAPLNSVEGFIRQILGWREYVRGIYWLSMPGYEKLNYLEAKRPLPGFYWGKQTSLSCVQEVVRQTATTAYSHHIQRLMITGNFALLAGLDPEQVCEWYLAVYADAYEWVELPNTLGMALFADGGRMASKPYAASGKYIHRMSDFCQTCIYDPNETLGEKACPFNALYWHFMHKNQNKLAANPRLRYAYLNWAKIADSKREQILAKAKQTLQALDDDLL